jgi:hypothetical protein
MAFDRAQAKQRVRTLTGWAAGGAAALTAAFAFGAAKSDHAASAKPASPSTAGQLSQGDEQELAPDQGSQGYVAPDQGSQGFSAPQGSTAPPAAMSGGS